jgi:PhnB protein
MDKENNVMIKKKKSASGKKNVKKPIKKVVKKVVVKAKKKKVLAIPKGYNSITPYLIVSDAKKAIDFYKKIFGAKQVMRLDKPDGKIAHTELKIGNSKIMLADECHEVNKHSPKMNNGCSVSIHLYVKDVDTVVKNAVKSGAKLTKPVENMFYGDRAGSLEDPYGHFWYVSTHVENVTPAQLRKRVAEIFSNK